MELHSGEMPTIMFISTETIGNRILSVDMKSKDS